MGSVSFLRLPADRLRVMPDGRYWVTGVEVLADGKRIDSGSASTWGGLIERDLGRDEVLQLIDKGRRPFAERAVVLVSGFINR